MTAAASEAAPTPRIALRVAQFREYSRLKGWTTARDAARAVGVDPGTLSRILRHRVKPSEKFIAAVLTAFPELKFEDLFQVVSDAVSAPSSGTVQPAATASEPT